MKKNGFTLIELLAVILILGIIALIAIPTVTNIIKESKRGAFKSSVQNIINAVETECQLEQMRGEELTTSYSFTNGSVDNELNIKGDLPKTGTITVDSSCNVSMLVFDKEFYASKSSDADTVAILDIKAPKSFAEDDWETIALNIKTGNLSKYKVGDTKEVALTGEVTGIYTVRIANMSTADECNTEGFSQTSCGFVVEFEDVLELKRMTTTSSNKGGWETSQTRGYVNDTIYNALPKELKAIIVDTKVVSGHGSISGEENFVTTDKLYLLAPTEIYGDASYDTSKDATRQLDYYKNQGVTIDNYAVAIKKYKESARYWWLRSAKSNLSRNFYVVDDAGGWAGAGLVRDSGGVSPAFRIGDVETLINCEKSPFSEHDWSTIIANVKAGNISDYNVGDTKEIVLTGDMAGAYTIRIANTSTPAECNEEGFSQTACGFVIEFEDIVSKLDMYSTETNVGGWEASQMRTYMNDTIYNVLPKALKESIVDTKVVSGHGNTSGETNFVTIDKLYLLSTKEVWGDGEYYDSAKDMTRQLDYYKKYAVTSDNSSCVIKKYKDSLEKWWLRTASSNYDDVFYFADNNGKWFLGGGNVDMGAAPAFRIG